MKTIDGIIILLYLVTLLFLGGTFFTKNKSVARFTLGSGNTPSWVVTLSIFATFVSSISYLALPGSAYSGNWNPFVFSISLPLAAVIAVQYFIPVYRKINSPSAYTYMAYRFGPWARTYTAACYLLTQLMRIGTILFLLALALNAILGWELFWVIILTGIFVALYAVLGGIEAVLWADAIQGIILIIGAIACVFFTANSISGGMSEIISIGIEQEKFSLGSFTTDLTRPTFWVVLIYGIFINLQNFGIDQNYIQRYMVLPSDTEAKKAAFFGGLLYLPVSAIFLFIGTALYVYYQSTTHLLPDGLPADQVFPYFIANTLPVGLSGLLVAAIFAAGMSTISTSFNSMATVFYIDFYQKKVKNIQESEAIKVLYRISIVIGGLGILIALFMINVKGVLDTWWKFASIFSGGMLGLFILGISTIKEGKSIPIIATTLGLLTLLWATLSNSFPLYSLGITLHPYLAIVLSTSTIVLSGLALFQFQQKKSQLRDNVKQNFD
ncbi:MAG: sodium/solute symporter [Flavobacteriaceae bacterium]